jgi:hypothetical protein
MKSLPQPKTEDEAAKLAIAVVAYDAKTKIPHVGKQLATATVVAALPDHSPGEVADAIRQYSRTFSPT